MPHNKMYGANQLPTYPQDDGTIAAAASGESMTGDQRAEFADLVLRVAFAQSDGYRDEGNADCVIAINNAAYMILSEMGYSGNEIREMANAIKAEGKP